MADAFTIAGQPTPDGDGQVSALESLARARRRRPLGPLGAAAFDAIFE